MKDLVTVFTPVYNRKNLIGNLYQSLLSQTYKNFEWIIVDDGSTDDIDEIIKSYQNEDRILIRFIKQENGGKHRAINNGVLHAKGELFYIVDSDDYLTKDSIERIVFHYQYIKNNDKFAGVCGMKCFPDGSRIGKEVTWKILKDSWINYWIIKNIKGDVAFVFKTSVLRNYLFDDIPGEKFCAESLVLNRIGKNYLMLFFNEKIYIAEYLSDGLSVSSIKNRMNSPNYAMRIYSEMASLDIPYLKKIKAHINYWRFAPCSKLKMKNKIKQIGISSYIIFMPIGYLFHMKDKKNNYIDILDISDLSGRTLFKRIKPLIKVFVIVDSYLPRKLNNFLFVSLRGIGGKVGIVIRYILVKNLAKKCGDNVVIKENVYISNIEKLELGDNISIHPMCYFECSGGLMIGNNVSIAHSSSILTSTHTYSDFNLPIKYNEILKKTVVIHDDVWIGCGVRILCGVHIDTRCIIGANSLVNKSVDSFSIYGGVPAKKIKSFQ